MPCFRNGRVGNDRYILAVRRWLGRFRAGERHEFAFCRVGGQAEPRHIGSRLGPFGGPVVRVCSIRTDNVHQETPHISPLESGGRRRGAATWAAAARCFIGTRYQPTLCSSHRHTIDIWSMRFAVGRCRGRPMTSRADQLGMSWLVSRARSLGGAGLGYADTAGLPERSNAELTRECVYRFIRQHAADPSTRIRSEEAPLERRRDDRR